MRLSGLVVRLSSLGMGLSGLWVRFSGLWVRFSGLGMGLSGLGMRLSGLGMRFSSDWSCSVLTYTMCPSSIQQMQMYVSNARGISEEGPLNAYDRQFVKLDLNQLFKVPRPSLWTCCSVCVVCRVLCECAYHRYFVVENIYFSLFWLIPATYMYYSRHTVCEMNWLYITWLIEVDFFLGQYMNLLLRIFQQTPSQTDLHHHLGWRKNAPTVYCNSLPKRTSIAPIDYHPILLQPYGRRLLSGTATA